MVVESGVDGINHLFYQPMNPINLDYFWNSVNNVTNNIRTDFNFIDRAKQIYENMHGSRAMQTARNLLRQVKNTVTHMDYIHEINTVQGFREANFQMQRWIMAEPTTRKLYHDQRCDGYSNTYTDLYPNDVGEQHYDYRRVMDGVVQELPGGGWVAPQYWDELVPGDRELAIDEKVDIINTWDVLKAFIQASKDDPTDIGGGTL